MSTVAGAGREVTPSEPVTWYVKFETPLTPGAGVNVIAPVDVSIVAVPSAADGVVTNVYV